MEGGVPPSSDEFCSVKFSLYNWLSSSEQNVRFSKIIFKRILKKTANHKQQLQRTCGSRGGQKVWKVRTKTICNKENRSLCYVMWHTCNNRKLAVHKRCPNAYARVSPPPSNLPTYPQQQQHPKNALTLMKKNKKVWIFPYRHTRLQPPRGREDEPRGGR